MKNLIEVLKKLLLALLVSLQIVTTAFSQDVPYIGGHLSASFLTQQGRTSETGFGAAKIGGVAFDKKAVLNPALQINDLTIQYDVNQPDGSRLKLNINGKKTCYTIYDWQLIPIIKYADSPYTACFTYFGNLTDKKLDSIIISNNGRILNYHPDLFNTLLGWRIGYMDMMVMYEFTTDLPKQNGIRILGSGEKNPDVIANATGQANFIKYLFSVESELGYSFRSYIITDYSREIQISMKNDTLNLNGYPYYRCWHFRYETKGFDMQKTSDSIVERYQVILNNELAKNPSFYQRGLYIDSLVTLSVKYKTEYPIYKSGTFVDLVALGSVTEKKRFLEQYTTTSLKEMLFETASQMEAYRVIFLTELSNRMSQYPEMLEASNPAIWNATVLTMRTAAFFRYVKSHFPNEWQALVTQVKEKIPEPIVRTPTVMYKIGNTVIEDAIKTGIPLISDQIPEIKVYPNPVKERLVVEGTPPGTLIELISQEGRTVIHERSSGSQHPMNLKSLKNGTYIIRICRGTDPVFTHTVVKIQ